MRKLLATILIFALVLTLCACGDPKEEIVVPVVFDAMSFWNEVDKTTISEAELIERLGEPDKVFEHSAESVRESNEIFYYRALYYNKTESKPSGYLCVYMFDLETKMLDSIIIEDIEIPYVNKEYILPMFNLKPSWGSKIINDEDVYLVRNCGVKSFLVRTMDDSPLKVVEISYTENLLWWRK